MNVKTHPLLKAMLMSIVVVTSAGGLDARQDGLESALLAMQQPEAAGTLIYRGTVFQLDPPGKDAVYTYERRVNSTAAGLSAAHITRDVKGAVIIAETAEFNTSYALTRFDAVNQQLGFSGSVVVSNEGHHLAYRLIQDGQQSAAAQEVTDPVVTGPSLHGFVRSRWDDLATGKAIAVRMIVLSEKDTYGFEIRHLAHTDGTDSFAITPSSLLIRLFVAPLTVTFDSATRSVLRYEGRVPPMLQVDGKLRALDARVDYTMNTANYR